MNGGSQIFLSDAVESALRDDYSEEMIGSAESRVLVLYTGGTIGMKNTPDHGYIPVSGYLTETLATMTRFNSATDSPKETVNVPLEYRIPSLEPVTGDASCVHTSLKFDGAHNNRTINGTPVGTATLPALVTPTSLYGKRIRYVVLEYDPLLDSANMTMTHWIKIATDIEVNYELFDAFIILHGTDTMAYTASALSFMLENLGKTVIITGSQVPISEVRNDAVDNLLGALTIAGHFVIPEVGLYFDHHLFRGNRSTKVDAVRFDAFDSPNLRPLVSVNIYIDVSWQDVFRPTAIACFRAHKAMNPNVATLRLFPGITESTVKAFLQSPIQGVVLETYGAGNAPNNRPDILDAFRSASDRGVVIVNCTQCRRGLVSASYATGKSLLAVGVIPGSDMTPECALTKLSYLLSKGCKPDEARKLITANLRGELTLQATRQRFTYLQYTQSLLQTIETFVRSSSDSASRKTSANPIDTLATGLPRFDDGEVQALQKLMVPIMLCQAAKCNDIESLQSLLSQFPSLVHAADYSGRTALHVAASEGQVAAARILLQKGAMVHSRDRAGHSALFDALAVEQLPVVSLLKHTGAHFNTEEQELVRERFFTSVCGSGNVAAMHCYVLAGVDLHLPFGAEQATAFHKIVLGGDAAELYYLYTAFCYSIAARRFPHISESDAEGSFKELKLCDSLVRQLSRYFYLFNKQARVLLAASRPLSLSRQLSFASLNSIDLEILPNPSHDSSASASPSESDGWKEQRDRVVALLAFNMRHKDIYGRTAAELSVKLNRYKFHQAFKDGDEILQALEALASSSD